jgi:ligand-binding sensor domain-containing protein
LSEYDMIAGRWLNFTQKGRSFPGVEDRLHGSYVEAVAPDVEGRMWYGTYEGGVACRDRDGHWRHFTTRDGLACNSCWGIWCDDDGTMWFSSQAGAQSLDLKRFRRAPSAGHAP